MVDSLYHSSTYISEESEMIDLYTALAPHKKFFPDTVHPNAEGATVIAQTVYHALTGKSAAPKVPVLK